MTATALNGNNITVTTAVGALYSSQYYAADNGGVNAISIPLTMPPNAYAEGIIWFTKFANTNTSGTVTAKVGSLAALPVVIDQAGTLPAIGSIIQNMFGMLCYSAAQNKLILLNPSTAIASFTGQLTGVSSGGSGTVTYAILPDAKTVEVQVNSNIVAASNSTSMTMTGIPSLLSSANQKIQFILGEDNSIAQMICVQNLNATTWAFTVGALLSTGFTNAGNKGLPAGSSFMYSLR